jgi:penicillin-binding protein 1A
MRKHTSHPLLQFIVLFALTFIIFIVVSIAYFEQQLPNVEALKTVKMQEPLRVYTQDKQLIAEFGDMRRRPVSLESIPKTLVNAIVATEDQRYFEHPGVDLWGLLRAGVELTVTRKKTQGGSTITMQVARNFFLTRNKTFSRKIREILLSLKISRELDKDQVLELYLNQVYLGNRAYGVASAAQIYYGKSLDELTLGEISILAGLPKAPSSLNPLVNPKGAKERRQHVLSRMVELNYISEKEAREANAEPIKSAYHGAAARVYAPYAAEIVRNQMVSQYGNDAYTIGLNVYTTINEKLQEAATSAVRRAVQDYDHRHGYRGPIANWGDPHFMRNHTIQQRLASLPSLTGLEPAIITSVHEQSAEAFTRSGETITIPWTGLVWAQRQLSNGRIGPTLNSADQVVKVGDVVQVKKSNEAWQLAQIPQVQAAIVSLNPQNGAVLALVGGYNFEQSNFNRIYQALRQPGSSFKPLFYAAALDKGMTMATIINDEPFTAMGSSATDVWEPQNEDRMFMGPIRLREALARSRNLVSVRVLQNIGIGYTLNYLKRFGFPEGSLPRNLSLSLGSGDVYPIQMAIAFSVFANGGYKINDYLMERVEDSQGKVLYQANPVQACEPCISLPLDAPAPAMSNTAPRVLSAQTAYLMTSGLQSVIQMGTGHAAAILGRSDLAGKTGTTNDYYDAWFNGFNSDIETVAWMGFDQPSSLHEYGAQTALPLWIDFMRIALQGMPLHTMPRPPELVSVKINPETGELAAPTESRAIFETFAAGTEPGGSGLKPNPLHKDAKTEALRTLPDVDNSVYGSIY